MYDFNGLYPDYDVTKDGTVYKNGKIMKPFKSNKYDQVLLFDTNHKRKVCGVHVVVAMKYLDYFDGCVVHHIDGNTQNNSLKNLEVQTRKEHSTMHGAGRIIPYDRTKRVPWNKGKKMSREFCMKCREATKRRKESGRIFWGNQYVDRYGNRK